MTNDAVTRFLEITYEFSKLAANDDIAKMMFVNGKDGVAEATIFFLLTYADHHSLPVHPALSAFITDPEGCYLPDDMESDGYTREHIEDATSEPLLRSTVGPGAFLAFVRDVVDGMEDDCDIELTSSELEVLLQFISMIDV